MLFYTEIIKQYLISSYSNIACQIKVKARSIMFHNKKCTIGRDTNHVVFQLCTCSCIMNSQYLNSIFLSLNNPLNKYDFLKGGYLLKSMINMVLFLKIHLLQRSSFSQNSVNTRTHTGASRSNTLTPALCSNHRITVDYVKYSLSSIR